MESKDGRYLWRLRRKLTRRSFGRKLRYASFAPHSFNVRAINQMNFYEPTPDDIKRERDEEDARIVGLVKKHNSSFKEWLLKPVVVAVITATLTTSITVPITILITNAMQQSQEQRSVPQ